jgi:gas vesicle protein
MVRALANIVDFTGGVVAGFAFGVVAALLLAPSEGEEMRARISSSAEDALQKPRDVVDDLQTRVSRAIEEGRQAAAEARAEMEQSAGIGRTRRSAEARAEDAEAEAASIEKSAASKDAAEFPPVSS